jgi:hypothetical protein
MKFKEELRSPIKYGIYASGLSFLFILCYKKLRNQVIYELFVKRNFIPLACGLFSYFTIKYIIEDKKYTNYLSCKKIINNLEKINKKL